MDTPTTPPVAIVQELIAIHTTRKEFIEKLKLPEGEQNNKAKAAAQQSDQFIAALLNELTSFGDAVPSETERENDYQATYRKILPEIDAMNPVQQEQAFRELEDKLKAAYQHVLDTKESLPETIRKLISDQKEKL
ncbi:MAG: hypothetical protein INR73_27240 [Williamsia sp.]|nr:hypothetical protein [Williamsia sp.]